MKTVIACGSLFLIVFVYGAYRLSENTSGRSVSLCLIGRDSPIDNSATDPRTQSVDLLLWPEGVLGKDGRTEEAIIKQIESCSAQAKSPILIGWERGDWSRPRNSVAFVDPKKGLQGFYDKTCLVPWSEYTPWLPSLIFGLREREYVCGDAWPVFESNGIRIAPAICFDVCFPHSLKNYRNCDLLAVSSCEEADRTSIVRKSLLQIVRLRAVELRHPIVRNVVAGYSGTVSGSGELLDRFEDRITTPKRIDGVPLDGRVSFYAIWGNWPIAFLMVGSVTVCLAARPRRAI
jgi:apolipoprotein N-acyltransferase